ncbi:MAG: serine protease [Planctomycetia bacterium]|nr:serine protease [Planctomycetia bacterium]
METSTERLRGPLITVVVGVWATLGLPAPADDSPLRRWAASVVTVEDAAGRRGVIASGVVVSAKGHVVTAWAPLRGSRRVRLRTHEGVVHDVLGVVAADRCKELVVLAMKRGTSMPPPAILVDRAVDVGETVHAIAGPGAEPLLAATDRVDAIESGARYRRTLSPNARDGIAPDQCRIVHHAYLGPPAVGGGLFGDDGLLLGVLVATADWRDRIHVAVHAGHIREVLDRAVAPRALTTLESENRAAIPAVPVDAETAAALRGSRHLPPIDGDLAARATTLRGVLRALRARLASIAVERRRIADRADRWRDEARGPDEAADGVRQQISINRVAFTTMVPEETIEESIAMADGSVMRRTVSAFSLRQVLLRQQLDRECMALNFQLARIEGERLRFRSRERQGELDLAALDRAAVALERETFFAGDPLAMRGDEEIEDALGELDAEIAEGRAAGVFGLLRGMWLTRLERFDDAVVDFDRVIEDDRALRPVAELARARAVARRDREGLSAAVARAARAGDGDPLMATVRARCAIDEGAWAAADTALQEALSHGGDTFELQMALARVALVAEGRRRNPRRAIDHARAACRASCAGDWLPWGLLGLATAAGGDWADAAARLSAAEPLVPPDARGQYRAWQTAVDERRLPIDWFAP